MMKMKLLFVFLLVTILVVPTLAQEGAPGGEMPLPEGAEVVLDGLNLPLGVAVTGEGVIWVADSGVGGEETFEMMNPATGEVGEVTLGETSRVMRLAPGEAVEEVAVFPSLVLGQGDVSGAAHLVAVDGVAYVTVGAWIEGAGEEVTIPYFGQVVSIADGEVATVADLWAHEVANNPDGTTNIEAHPYGITAGPDGLLYVADAAANALYSVNIDSGEVQTVAAFDPIPGVFPNPFRNNEMLADPVPTDVVYDAASGSAYVSMLSGAPFIPGTAKVVQVAADGTVSDFAAGLTMLTGMAMGPDGNLYVTQFAIFSEQGPVPGSGAVYRILPDGASEMVLGGLGFTTDIAIDADGNGYVLTGSPAPGGGVLLRFPGLTGMPAMAMPEMAAPMATEESGG